VDAIIRGIVADIKKGKTAAGIASRFHFTVAGLTVKMCKIIRSDTGIKQVVLSGGVFQNRQLLEGVYSKLRASGFKVYVNSLYPCNDGGIAFGQFAVAISRRER